MGIVIKVSGANYSNTGLGQTIEVTSEVDEIFKNYTNKDYARKQAVQKFINKIGGTSGALFAKFGVFQVPCLASIVIECFFDLKSNASKFPLSLNAGTVGTYYDVSQHGIISKSDVGAEWTRSFMETPINKYKQFSAVGLNPICLTVVGDNLLGEIMSGQLSPNYLNVTETGMAVNYESDTSSRRVENLVVSISQVSGKPRAKIVSKFRSFAVTSSNTYTDETSMGRIGAISQLNTNYPVWVQALGNNVTDAEADLFYSGLKTFSDDMISIFN